MTKILRLVFLAVALAVGLSALAALLGMDAGQSATEMFGHEANPTGDPIGGGAGYRNIFTKGDFTVTTGEEFVAALKKTQPGQVIYVPDGVQIDLSGQPTLVLPAGVTLAGSRGLCGSQGALVISKKKNGTMFASGGDSVRVTGLRFEGAYGGAALLNISSNFLNIEHYACEVDNCEVYNFNKTGIKVSNMAMNAHIHHSFLHHIQLGGFGYSVSTQAGDTRIIANRFDYGRHFIASSGSPGCGYEAAYNIAGPNSTSHQFDMHGGRDRGDGTDIAGDWLHIHHNTFEGNVRHVVIRGVPSQRAEIHHNVFAGPVAKKIIVGGNSHIYRNICGSEKRLEE